MAEEKLKSGLVILQDQEFWIQLEQMILDLKRQGIKTSKAELGAKLMKIGFQHERSNVKSTD